VSSTTSQIEFARNNNHLNCFPKHRKDERESRDIFTHNSHRRKDRYIIKQQLRISKFDYLHVLLH